MSLKLLMFATPPLAGGLEFLSHLNEWEQALVLAAAAVTAVGVIWRKVLGPLMRSGRRITSSVVSIADLLGGLHERLAGIETRLQSGGDRFERLESALSAITDLLRDEHVKDVRDLIRRGEIPQPPITQDDDSDVES